MPASLADVPGIVYMGIGDDGCNGTVIAPRWVLTAANCFDARPPLSEVFIVANAEYYGDPGSECSLPPAWCFIRSTNRPRSGATTSP